METPSGAVFPPYLIHHKQVLPSQISSGREVFFVYIEYPARLRPISDKSRIGAHFIGRNTMNFSDFEGSGRQQAP